MKVIRHVAIIGLAYKVLLATHHYLLFHAGHYRPKRSCFIANQLLKNRLVMDYNQLKLKILDLFNRSEQYASSQVLALFVSKNERSHSDKAIEMALLRYWRQGLLRRERRSGRFYYSLSERGEARRAWLRSTMGSSEA